jgi:hypothetical protein
MRDIKQEMDQVIDVLLNKKQRDFVPPTKVRVKKEPTQQERDEFARLVADVQSGKLFR